MPLPEHLKGAETARQAELAPDTTTMSRVDADAATSTRARGYPDPAPEVGRAPQPSAESGGEVVPFPGGEVAEARPGRRVVAVWFTEARESAAAAVDGSVWRARPPALRDSHARLQRAEWAAGVPALRVAGRVYGYPALAVRAVLLAVCWLLDHPTRALIAAGIALAALAPFLG